MTVQPLHDHGTGGSATGPAGSDLFADAPVMPYGSVSAPTPSAGKTVETGEPQNYADRSAWWKFTAPATESVGIDLLQSVVSDPYAVYPYVSVYTGTAVNALTYVGGGSNNKRMVTPGPDTRPSGYLAELEFDATAGTTYYVKVGLSAGGPDMSYVLRLGKRVYTYSDWIQSPDIDKQIPFGPTTAVDHLKYGVMNGRQENSGLVIDVPPGSVSSVTKDVINQAFDQLAGYTTMNNTGTGFPTILMMQGSVANDGNIFDDSETYRISGYARMMAITLYPDEDYDEWDTWLQIGQPGGPAVDYDAEIEFTNYERATVSKVRILSVQVGVGMVAGGGAGTPQTFNLTSQYSVLTGNQSVEPAASWDLSQRAVLGTFNLTANNQILTITPDADVSDGVDPETGSFVLIMNWPGVLQSGTFQFSPGSPRTYCSPFGQYSGTGLAPVSQTVYTFRPAQHRYIYRDIETVSAQVDVLIQRATLSMDTNTGQGLMSLRSVGINPLHDHGGAGAVVAPFGRVGRHEGKPENGNAVSFTGYTYTLWSDNELGTFTEQWGGGFEDAWGHPAAQMLTLPMTPEDAAQVEKVKVTWSACVSAWDREHGPYDCAISPFLRIGKGEAGYAGPSYHALAPAVWWGDYSESLYDSYEETFMPVLGQWYTFSDYLVPIYTDRTVQQLLAHDFAGSAYTWPGMWDETEDPGHTYLITYQESFWSEEYFQIGEVVVEFLGPGGSPVDVLVQRAQITMEQS